MFGKAEEGTGGMGCKIILREQERTRKLGKDRMF